VTMVQAILYV